MGKILSVIYKSLIMSIMMNDVLFLSPSPLIEIKNKVIYCLFYTE